jgi:hypothetical protein
LNDDFTRALLSVAAVVACHSSPITESDLGDAPSDAPSGIGGKAPAAEPDGGGQPEMPSRADGGARGEHNDDGLAGAGEPFDGPPHCSSGTFRDPNESEAPEMNPGFPCVFCHAASNAASGEGDAPIFAFAGTLYRFGHEPNGCVGSGAHQAEVIVREASGTERRAVANTSGNFLLEGAPLAAPFSVKVLFEGRERAAITLHTHGDCNFCHTELGAQAAPGRVVLP